MTHFVYMNTQKSLFKKKATFVRSGKVEMISTFQRNQHFRKMLVNTKKLCSNKQNGFS